MDGVACCTNHRSVYQLKEMSETTDHSSEVEVDEYEVAQMMQLAKGRKAIVLKRDIGEWSDHRDDWLSFRDCNRARKFLRSQVIRRRYKDRPIQAYKGEERQYRFKRDDPTTDIVTLKNKKRLDALMFTAYTEPGKQFLRSMFDYLPEPSENSEKDEPEES